jgi:anti-sigma factor RsiW
MNKYDDKWEDQINALLDGELSSEDAELLKAEATDDRDLARAIVEAYQLQQAMDSVHVERAPASLTKRLRAVPREQRPTQNFNILKPFLVIAQAGIRPQLLAIATVIPLILITVSLMQPKTPSTQEIEQARQDLAIAFAYLDKAGQFTGREIESTVGNTMSDAIAGSVIRTIKSQNETSKEKEV